MSRLLILVLSIVIINQGMRAQINENSTKQGNSSLSIKEDTVQSKNLKKVDDDKDLKVYTIVDEQPEFYGGENKLMEYLAKNIRYPLKAKDNGIRGTVYITFVITSQGKIKDIKILRGIGGGCDEETIRVIQAMPDWIPGKIKGNNVPVQYNLPVKYIFD